MKDGFISHVIYDAAINAATDLTVDEVRMGLGYMGVRLSNGAVGLAAVLRHELGPGCTVMKEAGTLAGTNASELMAYLVTGTTPLSRGLGLATANAIINPGVIGMEANAFDMTNLTENDTVAMVGYFGPLVGRIKQTGARLVIFEQDERRAPPISDDDKRHTLSECTVALITATSILNGTFEGIVDAVGNARHVVLLGPSTPLVHSILTETPVTQLSGISIDDGEKVMQIISEGGGTLSLKLFVTFINIIR